MTQQKAEAMEHGELIARLEAASEGSLELDEAIALRFYPWLAPLPRSEYGGWHHPTDGLIAPADPYTTSLDAIVALIERKLPGWSWGVSGALSPTCTGLLYEPAPTATGYRTKQRADGKTPAIALCIAFLRALRTQDQGDSL